MSGRPASQSMNAEVVKAGMMNTEVACRLENANQTKRNKRLMRKIARFMFAAGLTALFVPGLCSPVSAQVSTQPQKRNVLLEEFTGAGCGNCPDGAAVIASIKEVCGHAFHSIAIHAGPYAETGTDLKTPFGDSLVLECGVDGYPAGAINRYPYMGENLPLNMSRGYWVKTVKAALQEDAPVNLYASASIDADTRELTVEVEYCYTQAVAGETHNLNVALIQNHISGYQNQAPAGYLHEHVLRDLLTGQWGEPLTEMTQGTVYKKTYTETLPETIGGAELDIRNVEVVVFVTKGRREVQNVTAAKPAISNLADPVHVGISSRDLGSSRYGLNVFPFSARSYFNDTVREMEFSVDINGQAQTVKVENILLPPYSDGIFSLQVPAYPIQASNQAILQLVSVNGKAVEVPSSVSYDFTEPIACSVKEIYLEMKTDQCPDETVFTLRDADGQVVEQIGPFDGPGPVSVADTLVIEEPGIYALEFSDLWLDGWQEGNKGTYKVKAADGKLLGQNYSVTGNLERIVIAVSEDASSEEAAQGNGKELSLVRQGHGFRILNPASLPIERVSVYGIDGKYLFDQAMNVRGDVQVSLPQARSGLAIVRVIHENSASVFKLILP